MRTFAPLTGADSPVPLELLDALVDLFGPPGRWVVIGATARDFALILGNVSLPRRATHDTDVAIAARTMAEFDATIAEVGDPTNSWQRRDLLGHTVDVVPFGALEVDGEVLAHDWRLNVIGCAEAAAEADLLTLPSGKVLPVAPLELIALLKVMAFADRYPQQSKDAEDLHTVLRAASDGVYGDEVWGDAAAMEAASFDHQLAGAYRLGLRGIRCFSDDRGEEVWSVATQSRDQLRLVWRGRHDDLLDSWLTGIADGLSSSRSGSP